MRSLSAKGNEIRKFAFALAALCALNAQGATLNPDVRPETVASTICVKGYTESVRPSTTFTNPIKLRLMRDAGLPASQKQNWALDHRIPLVLGGHPRSLENLQLLTARENSRKGRLEVKLRCLVCSGQVTLATAQSAVTSDWQAAYKEYARLKCQR